MADARLGVDDDVRAKAAEQRHSAAGMAHRRQVARIDEQTMHVR
jgi:hypothetical protein